MKYWIYRLTMPVKIAGTSLSRPPCSSFTRQTHSADRAPSCQQSPNEQNDRVSGQKRMPSCRFCKAVVMPVMLSLTYQKKTVSLIERTSQIGPLDIKEKK